MYANAEDYVKKNSTQIKELIAMGKTWFDIWDILDAPYSSETIRQRYNKLNGAEMDKRIKTPLLTVRQLQMAVDQDWTYAEITARFGTSIHEVKYAFKHHGMTYRPKFQKIDPEVKAKVIELKNAGKSTSAISRELGIGHKTAKNLIDRAIKPEVIEIHPEVKIDFDPILGCIAQVPDEIRKIVDGKWNPGNVVIPFQPWYGQ